MTTWFKEDDYLQSKLAQLRANGETAYTTPQQVKDAIVNAGYTPLSHFEAFGSAERTSPNSLFDANQYLAAKAKQMGGSVTIDEVAAAIQAAGLTIWGHFEKWGWAEGVNPSNGFDTKAYMAAKLAEMQKTDPSYTEAQLYQAFEAAGLSPISHYLAYGQAEGLPVTPVPADQKVYPIDGKTETLAAGKVTYFGTLKSDSFTGDSATFVGAVRIVDESTTDNDLLNLTLTADGPAATVTNIENINVTWDSFASAKFDATNVSGATISLKSTKVGFLGDATVNNAGGNNVTLGEGMKGTLTVDGVTKSTVVAGPATTVVVDGTVATTDSVNVIAGAATTTVTVGKNVEIETTNVTAGAKTATIETKATTATIDATAAAKDAEITVNKGGAASTATVKLGNDAKVTSDLTGSEKLTLDIADGKVVTLVTNNAVDTVDVKTSGAATIKTTAANLHQDTITKSGKLTVEVTDALAALDVSKVDADLIKLTGAGTTVATVKSGANVEVGADIGTGGFSVTGGTSNIVNATFTKSQDTSTTFSNVQTANVVAAAAQAAAPTVTDLKFASLVNANNTVNLSGTNDVEVTSLNVKTLNASQLNGELKVTTVAAATDITIAGAQGKNDVTFDVKAAKASFVGQDGADTIKFGSIEAGSTVTAVTGAGNDNVTVNASALLKGAGAVSIDAGAGDDVVTLTAATATTGTIVVQFGAGNDTLKVGAASDFSKANLTVIDMNKLDIGAFATTVSASQFASFGNFELVGTNALSVDGSSATSAQTIDGSKVALSFGTTATLNLTGGDHNDTIIGANSNDTITGGKGADTLTGGAGTDTFVINLTGDTGSTFATADTITDFKVAGADTIKTGVAGDATNFTGASQINGATLTTEAAALAAADAILDGTVKYAVIYNYNGTGNGYLYYDDDGDVSGGLSVIALTGVNAANAVVAADIIA